jgi:arylsulfatase A-like enzyme
MGSRFYSSPHIDALASEGLVFMRAYASAANCAPSRACMMTGLNTPHHGIYTVGSSERGNDKDRRIIPAPNNTILHDSLTTLAEALQVFGYTTCHAGKWHLSENPGDHGFDYNIGGSHSGHPRSYYPPYQNVDLEVSGNSYLTDNIMDHVLDFLDTRHGDPFFLYYAPYAVHTPIHKVDSLMYLFEGKPGPPGMANPAYATMIYNLDRNIGRLTDKLKEMGVFDQTLIIFTSDNGGLFRISQQKPLRAGKGSYYEGGIRVPAFFVWKDHIEAGINQDVPIVNMDFFPTLLDIIGAQLPGKQFDGISLAPLLLENEQPDERALFWHFPVYLEAGNSETRDPLFRTRPGSAVIYGNWKLQEYFEDGSMELFNLSEDPGEMVNLVQASPEKATELQRMLVQWRKEKNAPVPLEPNPGFTDQENDADSAMQH